MFGGGLPRDCGRPLGFSSAEPVPEAAVELEPIAESGHLCPLGAAPELVGVVVEVVVVVPWFVP